MSLAPQPIRIRYGNAGVLGAAVAAAAANSNRNFQFQADRDYHFIDSMENVNAQAEQANLNGNRLQQAYAANGPRPVARQQQYDPSDTLLKGAYLTGAMPELDDAAKSALNPLLGNRGVSADEFKNVLSSNVSNAKNRAKDEKDAQTKQQKAEYLKSALAGMSEDDKASIAAAAEAPDVTLAQLRVMASVAQKKAAATGQASKDAATKKAFVQQVAGNLQMPGHADALMSMAEDPAANISHVRSAYSELLQRESATSHQNDVLSAQGIDHEAQVVAAQMHRIAGEMRAAGIDPDVAQPADLNPDFRDPSKGVSGFGARINDKLNPFGSGSLVTPNPHGDQMKAYVAYQALKGRLQGLIAQRQGLVGAAGSGAAPQNVGESGPPTPAGPGGGVKALSDDQLLQALNG